MTSVETVWDEELGKRMIVCYVCKKAIKDVAYSSDKGFTHHACG